MIRLTVEIEVGKGRRSGDTLLFYAVSYTLPRDPQPAVRVSQGGMIAAAAVSSGIHTTVADKIMDVLRTHPEAPSLGI